MIRTMFSILLASCVLQVAATAASLPSENMVIDALKAIIYHAEGNEPVFLSDLSAGLDGQPKELKEVILERLIVLEAKKYKISVSEDDLDRFIANVLQQNNWKLDDLTDFLAEHGYTYEEGRDLMRSKQMISQMLDYKIRSDKSMMVQHDDVKQYYDQHPHLEEASFTLAIAFVPDKQYTADQLQKYSKQQKFPDDIAWDEPFTLKQSELAEDRQFIVQKIVGTVVLIEPVEGGHELTKLISKTEPKTISFEEVNYQEIATNLRKERFTRLLESYHNELLSKAHIIYL